MKKCKRLPEAAVMEKTAEVAASAAGGRKRKVSSSGESELTASSIDQVKTRRLGVEILENSAISACESRNFDHVSASCCSSNGSSELVKEEKYVELIATISAAADESVESRYRRETTLSSEVQIQSVELESTTMPPPESNHRRRPIPIMPSDAELEEFFASAENKLQKEFINKYNYDIVKDEPLQGRYEWVKIELKP